ncbi:MAG TPA: hypothetical protein VFV38_28095 [Ktedonobacteraceae bacterium]|nr:hypothetical protein [Ktedonobacteraceae bacterium]
MKPVKNFYTSTEAQKRLGMDKNQFNYLVRKGTINGVVLPGHKRSVYPKTEVDNLAAALQVTIEQYERDESIFQVATLDDMAEEYALDASLYGKKTATIAERTIRLRKNPESDYVLKSEGEIVGHISFFPVNQTTMQEFVNGELADADMPARILPFTPGQPLEVLMLVMSVKPGFPPSIAKHFGQRLVMGTLRVFRDLGSRGVEINGIHATSRTVTGINICRKFGMQEEPVPNEKGRFHFWINPQDPGIPFARGYQEGLAEYRTLHAVQQ